MSLLVVGTLAFDSVQTPFGQRDATLGGSASFLSTAASYFGPVQMVGVIGDDFPKEHLDFFAHRNIDLAGVQHMSGRTFRWRGQYDFNLNNAQTLETQLNVLADFNPQLPESYKNAETIVLGNIDPVLQRRVLEQLPKRRIVACDTMNYWINSHSAALKETLKMVDILSVNDGEARQLSGEYNLVKAAKCIAAMGPKTIIVKRGEYGALLFHDNSIFAAPAYPLDIIQDPTGAGDSFAGGMMGYLANKRRLDSATLRQAVVMGSVLASFAVEDFSLDRFRTLTQPEINQRFAQFKALTHFESADAALP